MEYNERLMTEALDGNRSSLKELIFNAGAGNADAQYYLAMYYAQISGGTNNGDYKYWITKAKENGSQAAMGEYSKNIKSRETNLLKEKLSQSSKENVENDYLISFLKKFSFTGKAGRLEYIISIVVAVGLSALLLSVDNSSSTITILNFVFDWFLLSQAVRRLHDIGESGWWVLIPVISWIWIIFPKGKGNAAEEKNEDVKNLS